ncbi:MAG: hypothetical protein AAFX95_11375 [Cyanobacteria bacterium J06639_16]
MAQSDCGISLQARKFQGWQVNPQLRLVRMEVCLRVVVGMVQLSFGIVTKIGQRYIQDAGSKLILKHL